MFKFNFTVSTTYSEVPQANPLRWKTLFREDNNTFSDQSGWVKCKDFYNDTVAFFKEGSKFSIYGYQNAIKKNDEGVYFLLNFIRDKKSFLSNLEVVNKQLFADLGCVIAAHDVDNKEQLIVLIPNELWESTYRISMITMCIRLCNYGFEYKEWKDLWDAKAPAQSLDKAFNADAIKNALNNGFKVPEKFDGYWFYAGADYNSKKAPKITGGTIHNNGVCEWTHYMKAA